MAGMRGVRAVVRCGAYPDRVVLGKDGRTRGIREVERGESRRGDGSEGCKWRGGWGEGT